MTSEDKKETQLSHEEHEFLRWMMRQNRRDIEMWYKIKAALLTWLAIILIATVVSGIGYFIVDWFRRGNHS